MSSSVEQIKDRLSIEEVIGSYIKLERAGASLKARCPFHNEKTPSFFVSPERGGYYCFGCGAKGDIFTFVEQFEGVDFVGALKILADRAGVTLERGPKTDDKRSRIYALLEAATLFFERTLAGEEIPRAYLAKRGLTDATITGWRLGYVRDEWRSASDYLRSKGFSDGEIERAGITKTEKGSTYDRFRGRIMFPICDAAGRVIAFSGRVLPGADEHAAKYLNSPQTDVFDKSKALYGFDRAKQSIRKFDFSILVEGQLDLLLAHQAGFTNAVASSGTALTRDHLALLKRISNRIIMTFDGDAAGAKAAERAWAVALAAGMEVKIAELPDGTDPADLIRTDPEEFKGVLKRAVHLIDFLLGGISRQTAEPKKRWAAIRERVLPYVYLLESEIDKARAVADIARLVGAKEAFVWDDLKRVKLDDEFRPETREENAAIARATDNETLRRGSAERGLAGIIAAGGAETAKLRERAREILGAERFAAFAAEIERAGSELAFEAESYYGGFPPGRLAREADGLLLSLEEEEKNRERTRLLAEIGGTADEAKKKSLLVRLMDLSRIIERIKGEKKKFL